MSNPPTKKLSRISSNEWLIAGAVTGRDVGCIVCVHDADGNHYRPWVYVDGARHDVATPVAQLAVAARAIEDVLAKA